MSRRYGRNKKRAARERIEYLERRHEACIEAYNNDTGMLRQQLRSATRQLDTVKRCLGENYIGLDPETFINRTMTLAEPYDFLAPVRDGDVQMRSMSYRSFNESGLHHHRLHFRVALAGAEVGYVLSEPALYNAPAEFLARNIAHVIADRLVHDLRKARGGSNG